jgi:adenylate cyclase
MEAGRHWFLALWRSRLGTLALYGAITGARRAGAVAALPAALAADAAWEAAQYGLGLLLPALLTIHVVGTRIAWWHAGTDDR